MTTSLRQLAKDVGVSQPFLSQIRAGKRPMPQGLKEKLEALGAYHLLIADKQPQARTSGAGDGIRTRDNLLGRQGLYH